MHVNSKDHKTFIIQYFANVTKQKLTKYGFRCYVYISEPQLRLSTLHLTSTTVRLTRRQRHRHTHSNILHGHYTIIINKRTNTSISVFITNDTNHVYNAQNRCFNTSVRIILHSLQNFILQYLESLQFDDTSINNFLAYSFCFKQNVSTTTI